MTTLDSVRERFSPRTEGGRGTLVLALGTGIGQLLVVAAAPFLTRIYGPDGFGLLAVYASLLTVIVVPASLKYEVAIPLPPSDDEARSLVQLAFLALLLTVAMTALAGLFVGKSLAATIHEPEIARFSWTLPLGVLMFGAYQVMMYWRLRQAEYRIVASARLSQAAAQVIAQLGLGILGLGSIGLVLGDVVGRASSYAAAARGSVGSHFKNIRIDSLRRAAARWKRFPLFAAPSAFINTTGRSLIPLLLAVVYGPATAGFYVLGQRVMSLPNVVVGDPVSNVYFAEASRALRRAEMRNVRDILMLTVRRLVRLGVLPFLAAAVLAPIGFPLVFGEPWREAGQYVAILSPMYFCQFVLNPITPTFSVAQRQDLQLAWDITRLVVVCVLFAVASRWHLVDMETISVLSLAMVILYGFMGVLCFKAVRTIESKGPDSYGETWFASEVRDGPDA